MDEHTTASAEATKKAEEKAGTYIPVGDNEEESRALFNVAKAKIAAEYGVDAEKVRGWVTAIELDDDTLVMNGNASDIPAFLLNAVIRSAPDLLVELIGDYLRYALGPDNADTDDPDA